jgi:hypothetical protein
MRQYLSSLFVVLLGVACGGTTDTGSEGNAGSSSGGNGNAGTNQGGRSSAGAAGKASAGSSSGGSSAGSVGTAGTGGTLIIIGGTGTGGTGIVNPKCPAHKPMGACSADDVGTACEYEPGSGCLCYPSAPGTFMFCQKVDPNCVFMAAAGAGGVSAKIALPPHEVCSCVASAWGCTFN